MSQAIDITPEQRKTLLSLLSAHLPNTEAWVYGSRVRWTSRPDSDLDMVVFAAPEHAHGVSDLREAFEESDLPFRVDLFVWDEVPESFHEEIERERVVLVNPTDQSHPRWTRVALRELIDLRLSSVDKKSKPDEIPVRLCNYTDVYYNSAIRQDMCFMEATASNREIAKCALSAGDVVITKDSEKYDDIGVPAFVIDDMPHLVCGYHLAILRPNAGRIDGQYLYYALNTHDAQRQFHHYANGITRFGLRKADIGLVEIPLPILPEQRAIAQVLGALDDKIDLNRRMNETLEAMARAIFKDWFVDFGPTRAKAEGREPYLAPELWDLFPAALDDDDKPVGWSACRAGELFDFNPRESVKKGTNAPYLDMAALPIVGLAADPPTKREYKSGSKFRDGDALFARITPCLENGKTAYVFGLGDDVIGVGSTEFIVMRSRAPLPRPVSYLLARDPEFRAHAERSMTGTSGRQRANAEALSRYEITAPLDGRLWNALGDLIDPIMTRVMANAHESRILAKTRDLLLPKLMSGNIRLRVADGVTVLNAVGQPDYGTVS